MRIERYTATPEPVGLGVGTDEQEQVTNRPFFFDAGAIVSPGHGSETVGQFAMKLRQLRVRMELYIRRRFDAIDQIARHAGRQTWAAHQNVDLWSILR